MRPDPRRPARKPKPTLADMLAGKGAFDPYAPPGHSYPGQRTARDPWLDALMTGGTEFWSGRGVPMPDGIAVDVADSLGPMVGGVGMNPAVYGGDKRLVLDSDYAGMLLARGRDAKRPVRARRAALNTLGDVIYHELGHVGGLGHTPTGLMNEHQQQMDAAASLIRRLVPRPARG